MIETLETARLIMRPLESADIDALVVLHDEESFWWYGLQRAMTHDETAGFLARVMSEYEDPGNPSVHAVIERSTSLLAGWAGLSIPRF